MNSDFQSIVDIFNARSTIVSISTTDKMGKINCAPVGTATLLDEKTLFLLKGPLNQTYHNLKENQEAIFMALNYSAFNWLKFFLTGKFGASYGYRIYTRLREEREIDETWREIAFKRFRIVKKLPGGRVINNTLSKMLVFDVLEIREINPFN